jgi:hypothetical protein
MKALITPTLAALSLAGLLTGQAFAQTAPASAGPSPHLHNEPGCPNGFDSGDAAGVRVCHTHHHGWRLETTDPAKSGAHEYTGTLTTEGKFGDLYLLRAEPDDSAGIDGNGNLNFDFKTFSGIDGVHFRVDGGKRLTFNLSVDGHSLPPEHIWLGDNGQHPASDPFTLEIHEHHPSSSEAAMPSKAEQSPRVTSGTVLQVA